ncbi:WD40-repeat-containing domain protein, partial [Lactarius pseudohatsudake]
SVACSPTRLHVASGSSDKTIRVWDLQTGKPIYKPLRGHTASITAVAYSPDGNHIISASGDMTIRIWDSLTGALISTPLKGHTSAIRAITLSPDGKHIASGGVDNTIRIWDTQIGITINEPLRNHTDFIQTSVHSHIVKSGLTDTPWNLHDILKGDSQATPFKSFWDPRRKHFMSTRLQQAKITYTHQGANDGPDQAVNLNAKDIEVTYSSHPLVISSDGWLHTVDGGLLTYVPYEHWASICDMSAICVPNDAQGHPIKLDWNEVYDAWNDTWKTMSHVT